MKKGISLIALIITIIVIIILAAITINGVSGILERSRYAKFCADLDAVQEAVSQAYGSETVKEAQKLGEKRSSEEIYEDIAIGESEKEVTEYKGKTLTRIQDEKTLGVSLPQYGNSKWYVDTKTGDVYMIFGYEYDGRVYSSKRDIENGGEEADYEKFHLAINVDVPEGSIPVIYNGANWVIADTNSHWYDYRENVKQWANIMTIDESVRGEYLAKEPGTVISDEEFEKDVIGMFVYVPRYAYQITSHLHDGGDVAGNIDIVFINKQNQDCDGKVYSEEYPTTTLDGKDPSLPGTAEDKMLDFVVHPAFTDNAENGGWEHELSGIWVAKFEASSSTTELVKDESTDTVEVIGNGKISTNIGSQYGWSKNINNKDEYITIRPNVTSWRVVNITTISSKSREMAERHGLTNSVSHQMKNSEWGAVAYLTYSIYGNLNVSINSYYEGDACNTVITGMAGEKSDDIGITSIKIAKTYCEDGSIQMKYEAGNIKTFYPYNVVNAYSASSTNNIYGIYDLVGATSEYVAGYINNGNASYTQSYIYDCEKNEYMVGKAEDGSIEDNRVSNYEANSKMFGDAVYETSNGSSSWNFDYSKFPSGGEDFFLRGGNAKDGVTTGVFFFYGYNGSDSTNGFRVVVVQ